MAYHILYALCKAPWNAFLYEMCCTNKLVLPSVSTTDVKLDGCRLGHAACASSMCASWTLYSFQRPCQQVRAATQRLTRGCTDLEIWSLAYFILMTHAFLSKNRQWKTNCRQSTSVSVSTSVEIAADMTGFWMSVNKNHIIVIFAGHYQMQTPYTVQVQGCVDITGMWSAAVQRGSRCAQVEVGGVSQASGSKHTKT